MMADRLHNLPQTLRASKVSARMGSAPRAFLAGGLGFAVSFLVACGGGSGLLSSDQASNLNGQLDQVSSALGAGQCAAAANAATGFQNAIDDLPASVNGTLVNNLKQGASTVADLSSKDCRSHTTSTTTSTTTSSTTSTSPTSTPTTTSSSVTTPAKITTATTATGSGSNSTTSGSGGAGLRGSGSGGGSGGAGTG